MGGIFSGVMITQVIKTQPENSKQIYTFSSEFEPQEVSETFAFPVRVLEILWPPLPLLDTQQLVDHSGQRDETPRRQGEREK